MGGILEKGTKGGVVQYRHMISINGSNDTRISLSAPLMAALAGEIQPGRELIAA